MKSDRELQAEVLRELCRDTRVDAAEIGVAVHNGIATLTGVVSTCAEREAAEEVTLCVDGIHDVANDLQVEIPGHPAHNDTELAQVIRHALEWDPTIPGDRIRTTVRGGVVTLHGTVDSWEQVAEAEEVVGDQEGVRDLESELVIKAR